MATNQTPHIPTSKYATLRSGGSLKDGWSYLVPPDKFVLNAEVSVSFSDEELEDHVREQATALRALYLYSGEQTAAPSVDLEVESEQANAGKRVQFVVKRGLQVVGVARYSEETGRLTDVAIRPSAASDRIGETLIDSIRKHAKELGRSASLVVQPRSPDSRELFESMGFKEIDDKMIASVD